MSTTEFWNEEPELLWTYHSLYMQKEKREIQKMDFNAWLNGYYVCKALATCLSKGQKYPNQPTITAEEEKSNKVVVANKIKESLNRKKQLLDMRGRKEGQKIQ